MVAIITKRQTPRQIMTQYYTHTMPGVVKDTWLERHGAWLVSFFLHLSLLILFVTLRPGETPTPEKAEPIRLIFTQSQEEKTAEAQPEENKKIIEPEMEVATPELPPRPTTVEEIFPDIAEFEAREEAIDDILAEAKDKPGGYVKELKETRKAIDKRLQFFEIAQKAVPYFPEYKDARVGAIRTLDLRDIKTEIQEKVFLRYDMKISKRFVESVAPSFLSSAATGTSVYHATNKTGYYEVFEISEKAHRQMLWLEQNYLVSHGHDTRKARVDKVTFGIVEKVEGFWDLAITDIKVQVFTPIGEKTKTRKDDF
jgi:hypothetical protein